MIEYLEIQLRILEARLKAQKSYSMNVDLCILAAVTQQEIFEVEIMIAEERCKQGKPDLKPKN